MKNLIHAIINAPDELQILFFTATLFISWHIETIAGLTNNYKKWAHASLNAKFIFSNLPFQFLIGLAYTIVVHWTTTHHFGLIYSTPFIKNNWSVFIYSFILLDLGEYLYHLLMHKIKRLWMFHVVHHSDLVVDVSTSLREHPGENIIRNAITLIWVFCTGIPFWALLFRQIIQTISNVFAHLNCRLPEKLDRWVGYIFITPNLHHVHHHYMQPYTDCNYGDVFSFWDRIFGTFCRLPSSKIIFGVDSFMDSKDNGKYISLVKMPFGKYRKSPKILN